MMSPIGALHNILSIDIQITCDYFNIALSYNNVIDRYIQTLHNGLLTFNVKLNYLHQQHTHRQWFTT